MYNMQFLFYWKHHCNRCVIYSFHYGKDVTSTLLVCLIALRYQCKKNTLFTKWLHIYCHPWQDIAWSRRLWRDSIYCNPCQNITWFRRLQHDCIYCHLCQDIAWSRRLWRNFIYCHPHQNIAWPRRLKHIERCAVLTFREG